MTPTDRILFFLLLVVVGFVCWLCYVLGYAVGRERGDQEGARDFLPDDEQW